MCSCYSETNSVQLFLRDTQCLSLSLRNITHSVAVFCMFTQRVAVSFGNTQCAVVTWSNRVTEDVASSPSSLSRQDT